MSESTVEEELLWQIQCAGLPIPEREYRFHPKRKWQSDFAWPNVRLIVEVEGGIYRRGRHTRPAGYHKDCEKYNATTLMGWGLLRFTSDMVHDGTALRRIEEALAMANSNIQLVKTDKSKNMCFTLDTDPDLARRTFISRYGVEPKHVYTDDMVRVGPVPED
jgi:very-short-patch-repair endonuclease